jgi:predicted nucleic acid-binding Zn ribbon protein
MDDHSTRHIGSVLRQLAHDFGLQQKIDEYRAVADWPAIVGERIARVSQAERFHEGTLYVRLQNSVWRTELLFQKSAIIGQINTALGRAVVRDIKFL